MKGNSKKITDKKVGYWGEVSLDEMRRLNHLSEEMGWKKAVAQLLNKDTQEVISNEYRADWRYLTGINNKSKVLDVGCGLGGISFSLSKTSEVVYALEPVWERIRFVDIRRSQENIQNLKPICGSALDLPFPDNYFDLVVLNGVLEWAGYLTDEVKPNIAQERVLKEILRVLKPEGVLYIGIENRFAFFNFLGVKDPHTGLPFINLMPRFLANIYCLIAKKHRYKTYLYSYLGYRNLLKKFGFKKIKFYTPLPSYRNFRFIFPLDNVYAIKYWLEYLVLPRLFLSSIYIKLFFIGVKAVLKSPLKYIFKYITLDYSIIAAKKDYFRNEYEDIIISLEHDNRNTKVNTASFFYYKKSLEKKLLFCFLDNNKWPSYIWRITNEPEGILRLQNRYNVTKELSLLGPQIAKVVPICKYSRFINNEAVVLNSFKKSTMPLLIKYLSKHRRSLHKMDDIFSLITGWLIVLHKKSCAIEKIGNSSIFKNIISNSLELYAKRMFLNKQDYGYLSNTLEKKMVKIGNLFLPFVIQHGDFQPENILYDERNRDILIFDWECALIKGLPLIDLLDFLITSATFTMEDKNIYTKRSEHIIPLFPSLIYNINLQIFKRAFYEKNKISDLLKKYIDIYCKDLNIDKRLKRILFLIFILQYLWHDKIFMQTFLDNENNIFKEDF